MLQDSFEIGQIIEVPVNSKLLPAVITSFTKPNNDIANRQLMEARSFDGSWLGYVLITDSNVLYNDEITLSEIKLKS
jgi:hypothetical protein